MAQGTWVLARNRDSITRVQKSTHTSRTQKYKVPLREMHAKIQYRHVKTIRYTVPIGSMHADLQVKAYRIMQYLYVRCMQRRSIVMLNTCKITHNRHMNCIKSAYQPVRTSVKENGHTLQGTNKMKKKVEKKWARKTILYIYKTAMEVLGSFY